MTNINDLLLLSSAALPPCPCFTSFMLGRYHSLSDIEWQDGQHFTNATDAAPTELYTELLRFSLWSVHVLAQRNECVHSIQAKTLADPKDRRRKITMRVYM